MTSDQQLGRTSERAFVLSILGSCISGALIGLCVHQLFDAGGYAIAAGVVIAFVALVGISDRKGFGHIIELTDQELEERRRRDSSDYLIGVATGKGRFGPIGRFRAELRRRSK